MNCFWEDIFLGVAVVNARGAYGWESDQKNRQAFPEIFQTVFFPSLNFCTSKKAKTKNAVWKTPRQRLLLRLIHKDVYFVLVLAGYVKTNRKFWYPNVILSLPSLGSDDELQLVLIDTVQLCGDPGYDYLNEQPKGW